MFLTTKKVKNWYYLYIIKSIRNHKRPRSITLEYMGRAEKYSKEEIDKLKNFLKNNDPNLMDYIGELKQKYSSIKLYTKKRGRKKKIKKKRIKNKEKNNKCIICGFESIVHLHHIIPSSEGGNHKDENLVYLCPNHHAMVHKRLIKKEQLLEIKNNVRGKEILCKG